MLPLAKVAAVAQTFCDPEGRNDAAFDALPGLSSRLGGPAILSTGLVEVRSEPVPLGENGLQEGVEPFCAGHRLLQLGEKKARIHIS